MKRNTEVKVLLSLGALLSVALCLESEGDLTKAKAPAVEVRSVLPSSGDAVSQALKQAVDLSGKAFALITFALSVTIMHFMYVACITIYDFSFGYRYFVDQEKTVKTRVDTRKLVVFVLDMPQSWIAAIKQHEEEGNAHLILKMYYSVRRSLVLERSGSFWPAILRRYLGILVPLLITDISQVCRLSISSPQLTFAVALAVVTLPCLDVYNRVLGEISVNERQFLLSSLGVVSNYQMIYEADCREGTLLREKLDWIVHRHLATLAGLAVILLPAELSRWVIYRVSKAFKFSVASGNPILSNNPAAPTFMDHLRDSAYDALLSGGIMLTADETRQRAEPFRRNILEDTIIISYYSLFAGLYLLGNTHRIAGWYIFFFLLMTAVFSIWSSTKYNKDEEPRRIDIRWSKRALNASTLTNATIMCMMGRAFWANNFVLAELGAVVCATWILFKHMFKPPFFGGYSEFYCPL